MATPALLRRIWPPVAVSKPWVIVTTVGAGVATCLDAVLLQRKHAFFTGGFLATDHLRGAGDVATFLAASCVADASVIGAVTAIVLWTASRLRLSLHTACALALLAGLGPWCATNVISYRLAGYVGDVVNLALMFDLTGRSLAEVLAVGYAHLAVPLTMLMSGGLLVVGLAWTLHRYTPAGRVFGRPIASPGLAIPLLLTLSGTTLTGAIRDRSSVLDNGLRRKPSGQLVGRVVAALTDFDHDGFGWLSRPPDPDPWDRRIVPYAIDVPGNGIDENGVGADLPAAPPYVEGRGTSRPWNATPDVVLIVLESFRADLVGAASDGLPITPVLNRLAANGASASRAFSHNGYTTQSRHHIFSGSLANIRQGTLIDDFKANGYQVAYFSSQDESFGGPALGVGFERSDVAYDARLDPDRRYSTFTTPGSLAVPFSVVLERLREFLEGRSSQQPLFLYVNFHDTHFPYRHAGIHPLLNSVHVPQADIGPARRADIHAMYANTAANVDRAVGQVLDTVRRTQGADPAVIVTADHGESFFEDGMLGHGMTLNDEQTRIPLIVSNLPMTIDQPVGQAALRDAIGRALEQPQSADPSPRLRETPDNPVFQYLGRFEAPAQIALARRTGRTIFDFRTGRVKLQDSTVWQRPDTLSASETRLFLEVVHRWERMRLAFAQHESGER